MSTPLLAVKDLRVRYASVQALFGASLEVQRATVLAVLGANGAGKSTLARALAGLVPSDGSIVFDGHDVSSWPPHRIRRAGFVHIPESRGIFPGLSVRENLEMAVLHCRGRDVRRAGVLQSYESFPVLSARSAQPAGTLSGGEQQMLALACALAVSPKLIVADEMSLGLAPQVVDSVFNSIEHAVNAGVTVILIEQFVHRALSLATDCVILRHGEVAWSGPAAEAEHEVVERYLGEQSAGARS